MKVRQESDTLARAAVLLVTAGVIAGIVVGAGLAALLMIDKHQDLGGQPFTGDAELNPPAEVNAMEMTLFEERAVQVPGPARGALELETWGWADPAAGLVRIPVSRAIERYLERRRAGGRTGEGGGQP